VITSSYHAPTVGSSSPFTSRPSVLGANQFVFTSGSTQAFVQTQESLGVPAQDIGLLIGCEEVCCPNDIGAGLEIIGGFSLRRCGKVGSKHDAFRKPCLDQPAQMPDVRGPRDVRVNLQRRHIDRDVRMRVKEREHRLETRPPSVHDDQAMGVPDSVLKSIAGHITQRMLEHYSNIRMNAKRQALDGLDAFRAEEVLFPVARQRGNGAVGRRATEPRFPLTGRTGSVTISATDVVMKRPKQTDDMLPLTPAVFHILLALSDGERHGYAIMREVAADTNGSLQLGPGTLYGCLKRMLAARLVEETDERPDPELDDERRRYYRITDFGARTLRAEAERLRVAVSAVRTRRLFSSKNVALAGTRH
jgi:DNA-binding PadR family transcriptional regulator